MRKYAVIKDYKIVSIEDLEDEAAYIRSLSCQNLIDVTDLNPLPQVGWKFDGRFLMPVAGPVIDAEYIKQAKVLPIKAFVDELMNKTIAENILMGITQANKTGTVLSFALRKVTVPSSPDPMSLYGALVNLSLFIALEVLEYHITHPEEYSDLAPFVTVTRLTGFKNSIRVFLGLPPV